MATKLTSFGGHVRSPNRHSLPSMYFSWPYGNKTFIDVAHVKHLSMWTPNLENMAIKVTRVDGVWFGLHTGEDSLWKWQDGTLLDLL